MTFSPTSSPPLDQPYYGVPFLEAQKRFVQKAFVYAGRASPSEYWFAGLGIFCAIIAGEIIFGLLTSLLTWIGYQTNSYGFVALLIGLLGLTLWLMFVGLFVAGISLTVRRLHDTGRPGTYYLFSLIPFAGSIILLVFVLGAPSPFGLPFDAAPGATRGYLFVRRGGAPFAAPGFGAAAPHGYAAPVMHAAPTQGFASGGGYATPAVTSPMTSAPPVPAAPVPGQFVPSVPAASVVPVPPVSPVPPVPAPVQAAPPLVPPVPASSVPGVPPVPAAPTHVVPTVPPAPSALAVPPVPARPVTPPAPSGPIQSVPGLVSAVPAVPAPAFASSVDADDELDSTRITARPTGSWRIVLADGRQIPLGSSARVGRDPGADPADPAALLVSVDDATKSISKTHVALSVTSGGILITDLHSTNGSVVCTADGAQTVLSPEVPYGVGSDAELRIGDYVIQLRREGN